MQLYLLCLRDVFVKVIRSCGDIDIVDGQMGKPQVPGLLFTYFVLSVQLGQCSVRAEIDGSVRTFDGRIPVELLAGETVFCSVVSEDTRLWIHQRETVVRRNPQLSAIVLHDPFHGIVRQSLLLRVALEVFMSLFVSRTVVKSVFVAAQPYRTVVCLAETAYLFYDTAFWRIQPVTQYADIESPFRITFFQVNDAQSVKASYPQFTFFRNQ